MDFYRIVKAHLWDKEWIFNKTCTHSLFAIILFMFLSFGAFSQEDQDLLHYTLKSPDNQISLSLYRGGDSLDDNPALKFRVAYQGEVVIEPVALNIQMDNHLSEQAMALKVDTTKDWCEDLKVIGIESYSRDSVWQPVYGERKRIRDHYNALTIHLEKESNPIYKMDIRFRAYNEGVAVKYFFPENPKGSYYHITSENTSFSFPPGTMAYFEGWAQGPYQLLPLKNWPQAGSRPLTLKLKDSLYASLTEAQMTDYARTKFRLDQRRPNTITTALYGDVDLISPFSTPWRVILIGNNPGDLLAHNYLLQNLNKPDKLQSKEWIKPGKIIRVMDQTTAEAKKYIDFAQEHRLQYILFDWKWYGPAFSFESDATKPVAALNMPEIIRYGKEKGIGVWLYVNQQALLKQSDSLFRVYRDWGIKGVKFGFVQVGSHRWTTWLQRAIKQAAENNIMVNIHDEFRSTGEERTFPNLMTVEGVRGNEEMPDATHNTILPFTRFISGPADYTICYYDERIKTTHAHQLALSVIYYSPIQTLFWYDKPSDYRNEPEVRFFEEVPTTWDNTRVIGGAPGEYVLIARKKGRDWFLGAITNNRARSVDIPLDFLDKGKKFNAEIYLDDPNALTRTHVGLRNRKVKSADTLRFNLEPSGGVAIHFKMLE